MEEQVIEEQTVDTEVQDTVATEAPESVPMALSSESGTTVAPEPVISTEGLTGALTAMFDTSGAEQGLKRKRAVLVQGKTPLLGRDTTVSLSGDDLTTASKTVEYANVALQGATQDPVQLRDTVAAVGLSNIREEVARKDLEQRKSRYSSMLSDALSDINVSVEETARMLRESQQLKPNRTALEENAVTGVMTEGATKDPEWAAIFAASTTATEELQDSLEEQILLFNYLSEKKVQAEQDFDYGRDFIRGITSLDLVTKLTGFGADWADNLTEFGRRFRSAQGTDAKLAVLEEFDQEVKNAVVLSSIFGQNADFDEELATIAFSATPQQRKDAALLGGVEGVLTLIGAGATAKALAGMSRQGFRGLKSQTGAKDGAEVLDEAAQEPRKAGTIPTMTAPDEVLVSDNAKVKEVLERQQRVVNDTVTNLVAPVMRTEDELLPVFDKGNVFNQTPTSDGRVLTDFGTAKGNPFASESIATRRAKELELDNFTIVPQDSGFVIRHEHEFDAWGAPKAMPRSINKFTRLFDNIDNWIDGTLHAKGRLAESAYSQIEKTFREVWKSGFKGLGTKQRRDVSRVLEKLRNENTTVPGFNRWYTEGEFRQEYKAITGQDATDKEIVAYGTFKQLNDFAYRLDNQALYRQDIDAGYTGVRVDFLDAQLTGKIRTNVSEDTEVYVQKSGELAARSTLDTKDYDFIELNKRDKSDLISANIMPAVKTRIIAVPKGTAVEEALENIRIPYLAGGRLQHDNSTVWLKQANVKGEGGSRIRLRDKTMYRASTLAEAKDYAIRWNKAKDVAREFMNTTPTAAARAEFREFNLGELDDFIQNAKAYDWDLTQNMQALRNREMVQIDDMSGLADETSDLDYILEGVGNRFSRRGQGVPHILGDAGDGALDPFMSLSQSIDMTARNAAFGSYRQFALERFKHKYGRYLDIDPSAPLISYLRASPNQAAQRANLIQSIEGHQNYIRTVINSKFEDERTWDRYVQNAADWTFGKDFGPVTGGTVARGLESIKDIAPMQQMRNLTFNAKLGMGNPASFIMQAAQAPVIAATVPKFGVRALTTYPMFRMALFGIDELNNSLWKEFMAKSGRLSEDIKFLGDFQEAVKEFRRLGIDNFGGNMAYIDAATGSNVLGLARTRLGDVAGSIVDKGRVFFNEGEMIPRMVSYMSARARWLSDDSVNPKKLPATSNAGRQWILDQTDKYMFGMSRADIQQGLRGGITGFATQFYSFILRATMAFTGRQFTKGEKVRMALAYTVLYGGAGLPFMDSALDAVMKDTDAETRMAVKQGAVDAMLSEALGYQTNFSDRAGIGKAWGDIWGSLFNRDTFMETVAGAPGQTGHRALDGVIDAFRLFSAVNSPDVTDVAAKAALSVGRQISSFNNTYKAIQAWNAGVLLDNTGLPYMPMERRELVGAILGVPTIKYEELNDIYTSEKKRADAIKDGVQDILVLMELAADQTDPAEIKKYQDAISFRMNGMYHFGIGDDVTRRVFRSMSGETMYKRKFLEFVQRRNAEGTEFYDSSAIEARLQREQQPQQEQE